MTDTDQVRKHLQTLCDELVGLGYTARVIDQHPLREVALAIEQPGSPGRVITVICDTHHSRPCFRWPHDHPIGYVTEPENVARVLAGFLGPPRQLG